MVTRQIAIPGRIPLGGGAVGGAADDAVYVLTTPGLDGPDSVRKAQAELHRPITFGHTRALVFSEAFARRGISDYVDYVRRVPDVRRVMMIAVAEGSAEALVRARPKLESLPVLFLNDMLDDAVKTGRLPRVHWGDFLVRLSNKGEDAIAPLVRMAGPDEPELAGLAVFRGDRMVGKLTLDEVATFMQLKGYRRGAELIRVELEEGGYANLRVYTRLARNRVAWADGRVQATVKLELECDLASIRDSRGVSIRERLGDLEQAASATVERKAMALIDRLQHEFGADILALGEQVRAYLPQVWRSVDDWNEAFAEAQIRVEAKVHIRRTGMAVD